MRGLEGPRDTNARLESTLIVAPQTLPRRGPVTISRAYSKYIFFKNCLKVNLLCIYICGTPGRIEKGRGGNMFSNKKIFPSSKTGQRGLVIIKWKSSGGFVEREGN